MRAAGVAGHEITRLIQHARDGGDADRAELFATLYEELKKIARATPHVGRVGDTLQPTVVTNEVFIRLLRKFPDPPSSIPESRATFFRTVALAMRAVVHDHWRAQQALKRGGGLRQTELEREPAARCDVAEDALALHDAVTQLEQYNPRWFEVVLHRYYAGRSIRETAALLNIAESTVSSDWTLARAWLARKLNAEASQK